MFRIKFVKITSKNPPNLAFWKQFSSPAFEPCRLVEAYWMSGDYELHMSISMWYWCYCYCCCCCHRYMATELPLRYRRLVTKTSRCYKVIAGLWTAALITFIAPILTKPNWIYYRYNVNQKMCGLHWEYPSFCVITGLYIPILSGAILIFTGLRIRLTLHRRRNGQSRVCENISRSPISVSRRQPALGQPSRRSTTRGSRRTLKILTFTSVAYFTFWSPYVVIVLAQSFVSSFQPPSGVEFAVMWLANTNSAVNVFIYSATNTQFRRQCVRLASQLCCSTLACYQFAASRQWPAAPKLFYASK